jgi:multisubunit Na+/H+ antiporter MnhF subunit
MFKNITQTQWLAIGIGVLTGLTGLTTQLTTIFGPTTTTIILAADSIIVMIISVVLTVTTGQGSVVQQVAAMPGVTRISVNAAASPALAAVATDPATPKVGPTTPDIRPALVAKAAS